MLSGIGTALPSTGAVDHGTAVMKQVFTISPLSHNVTSFTWC